jgi:hypothetical protein
MPHPHFSGLATILGKPGKPGEMGDSLRKKK